jgi:hypothetical protein
MRAGPAAPSEAHRQKSEPKAGGSIGESNAEVGMMNDEWGTDDAGTLIGANKH